MAKIDLTQRERFALYARLNTLSISGGRAEQRRLDKLWTSLRLDDIGGMVDRKPGLASQEMDHELRETFAMTSDERDALISWCEPGPQTPMAGWLSRLLYSVSGTLIRSRDGEDAAPKEEIRA